MSHIVYHNPDVDYTYYLLIPNPEPNAFKILLQKHGNAWSLPSFSPKEHHFAVVQHINNYVKAAFDLEVSTLRCFKTYRDKAQGEQRYYSLDNLSPDWERQSGLLWFEEADLNMLTFTDTSQYTVLMSWFDWRHSDNSLRVAWMREGWFRQTRNWILDLADRMEMTALSEPKQVRTWVRSSTIELETDDGTLYFKAVPKIFNYEPIVTRVLSIRHPESVPDVRAVHVENGWMLMRDFGSRLLSEVKDIEVWKQAICNYAKIQTDMTSSTQSLVALGVPDRNVDYLASQIDQVMHDLPTSLSEDEQKTLAQMASTLRSMCIELADFFIPLTITHGDFWSGNTVIKADGSSLFFDWSDASVSHPFFDIVSFLSEIDAELAHIPDAKTILLETYLEQWTMYEPMSNLKHAYQLAEVLANVHQALFYYVHVLPGVESAARWELSGMLVHFLRQIIVAMQAFRLRKRSS